MQKNQKNKSSKLNKKAEQKLAPYNRYYNKIPFLNVRNTITNNISQEDIIANYKEKLTKNDLIEMSITPDETIIESESKIKETIRKLLYLQHYHINTPYTIFEVELYRKLQNHNSKSLLKNNNLTLLQLLLLDYAVINQNTRYVSYIFVLLHYDNEIWSNKLSVRHDMYNVALYYATLNDVECTKQMLQCIDIILEIHIIEQRQCYSKAKKENADTKTIISEVLDIYSSLFNTFVEMFKISLHNRNPEMINLSIQKTNHYLKSLLEPSELTMEIKNQYLNYVKKIAQKQLDIIIAVYNNQEHTPAHIINLALNNMSATLLDPAPNKEIKDLESNKLFDHYFKEIPIGIIAQGNYAPNSSNDNHIFTSGNANNQNIENTPSKDEYRWRNKINQNAEDIATSTKNR